MATNASPFVVNIVPLQGIATGIAGTADASQIPNIQTNLANLQSMVNFTTKTISVDTIQNYTSGQNIQVLNDLNLCNASLYSNGSLVSGSGSSSAATSLTFATATTITGTASTMTFMNAGQNVLQILSTGALQYTSPQPSLSTGVNINGYLYVSKSAYAQNWYQTSDRNQKTNIVPFSTCLTDILKLEPCTFNWLHEEEGKGEPDVGFIAQDVKSVWPMLTTETDKGLSLAYSRFVPLLLEGLRELHGRVSTLEAMLPALVET